MWDRSYRNNPLSYRYQENSEYRAILPEDSSGNYLGLRKESDPYRRIYYYFVLGQDKRILLNNNMNAEDRERLKQFYNYKKVHNKNLFAFSLIPSTFLYGLIKTFYGSNAYKMEGVILFLFSYSACYYLINRYVGGLDSHVASYYYHKYANETVSDLSEISDKRRQFFRPDTSVPYRESHQEIYDRKTPSELHDSSIYYGPHPYDDFENAESVVELNKKFLEGHSKYDDKDIENVLGDKINIRRRIRHLPTVEEYRKI